LDIRITGVDHLSASYDCKCLIKKLRNKLIEITVVSTWIDLCFY